jgi:hypothetical protein
MRKKKLIQIVATFVAVFFIWNTIAYLMVSFVTLTFSPADWTEDQRIGFIGFGCIIGLIESMLLSAWVAEE